MNTDKSKFIPSKIREFLGFEINTMLMTLSPTSKKRGKILRLINKFLKLNCCTIRNFASLLGNLVSVCMAISYGFAYTKILEKENFLALERSGGNYDCTMNMSKETKLDLLWWQKNILIKSSRIKQYNFATELFSDAS